MRRALSFPCLIQFRTVSSDTGSTSNTSATRRNFLFKSHLKQFYAIIRHLWQSDQIFANTRLLWLSWQK